MLTVAATSIVAGTSIDHIASLNLSEWCNFPEHRSGWDYAMRALLPLHNEKGVKVIDFMEKTFSWDLVHVDQVQDDDTKTDFSAVVLDKEVWYLDMIWNVATGQIKIRHSNHTILLQNGHIVSYEPIHQEWIRIDMTGEEFIRLPRYNPNGLKEIWFDHQLWQAPIAAMKMYQGCHTFQLSNGTIVSFDRCSNQWKDTSLTHEEFEQLRSQQDGIEVPWVGFFHNPPGMPLWFDYDHSPRSILERAVTQKSLKYCLGIFVFSQYMKDWLEKQPEIPEFLPISVLYHPTAFDGPKFSFDAFVLNQQKSITQIGYWLRVMSGIAELKVPDYFQRKWLYSNKHAFHCLNKELASRSQNDSQQLEMWQRLMRDTVHVVDHLNNQQYDDMLTRNIVFLQLYDSSCNNAVIECIVRGTPILINKLPPVVEYLGPDYPFYYETLEEASKKLRDMKLIKATHDYLLHNETIRSRLTDTQFLKDVKESEVYANIMASHSQQLRL